MRLLHVIPSLNLKLGGVAKAAITLCESLASFDIESEVACLDLPEDDFATNQAFKVHVLGPTSGPWQHSSRLMPWLKKNIQDFDVVIIHGLWLYHVYAVWKAICQIKIHLSKSSGKSRPPRLFIMAHGMLDPYFQNTPDRRLKALRNWIYWKFIESKIVNEADGLLFTCETELLLARKTFRNYHPHAEFNIGYGVDMPPPESKAMKDAFAARCPELGNGPYLLFLSRIHQKKGVDLLIMAYQILYHEFASIGEELPKLVIAGPGLETAYGKSLLKLVDNVLEDQIYFSGMLSGDAKWGAFYGCEAFVLISHQENFGIAVAEALGCGKPVLLSNQVNIWREIELGEGGIVGEDTLVGAVSVLRKWLGMSTESRLVMANKASFVYGNCFTVEKAAQKLSLILSNKLETA